MSNVSPLARARRRKNLTQSGLARLVGVDPSAICRMENTQRKPNRETAQKIAAALEISELELFYPERFRTQRNGEEIPA